MPKPELADAEKRRIVALARSKRPEHVVVNGREYWADPNGAVFVVAWEDRELASGDKIEDAEW